MKSEMTDKYSTLTFELNEGIGHIMINQPPSNEMTLLFFSELAGLTDRLPRIKDMRGILISGKGRHFSSGARLSELLPLAANESSCLTGTLDSKMRKFLDENNRSFLFFEEATIPVVTAIRGVCLGSALELTLFTHFRFCGEDAVFGLPETTFNLMPGIGGISKIYSLSGTAAALEVVLRGNTFSAEEALRLNLVDQVFPKKEVVDRAREFLLNLPSDYSREKSGLYLKRFLTNRLHSSRSQCSC
jgi:enoyl-CoA hydratase/carnithine racemase